MLIFYAKPVGIGVLKTLEILLTHLRINYWRVPMSLSAFECWCEQSYHAVFSLPSNKLTTYAALFFKRKLRQKGLRSFWPLLSLYWAHIDIVVRHFIYSVYTPTYRQLKGILFPEKSKNKCQKL